MGGRGRFRVEREVPPPPPARGPTAGPRVARGPTPGGALTSKPRPAPKGAHRWPTSRGPERSAAHPVTAPSQLLSQAVNRGGRGSDRIHHGPSLSGPRPPPAPWEPGFVSNPSERSAGGCGREGPTSARGSDQTPCPGPAARERWRRAAPRTPLPRPPTRMTAALERGVAPF